MNRFSLLFSNVVEILTLVLHQQELSFTNETHILTTCSRITLQMSVICVACQISRHQAIPQNSQRIVNCIITQSTVAPVAPVLGLLFKACTLPRNSRRKRRLAIIAPTALHEHRVCTTAKLALPYQCLPRQTSIILVLGVI